MVTKRFAAEAEEAMLGGGGGLQIRHLAGAQAAVDTRDMRTGVGECRSQPPPPPSTHFSARSLRTLGAPKTKFI